MFYIFTGSLITGLAFMTLGKYAAYLAVVEAVSRITFVLLAGVIAVLLLRKFWYKPRKLTPQALVHRR